MKKDTSKIKKPSKHMMLKEFTPVWQEIYACNYLENSTESCYDTIIQKIILPHLGNLRLCRITSYDIEKFFVDLAKDDVRYDKKDGGYSFGTIQKAKTVLSSILSTAVHWKLIKENPCLSAKLPKHDSHPDICCFNRDEARQFLQYVDKTCDSTNPLKMQYRVLFHLALFGGMRRGELLALQWKHIHFSTNQIVIEQSVNRVHGKIIIKQPKTLNSIRTVTFPDSVMKLLWKYRDIQNLYKQNSDDFINENNLIFTNRNGSFMNIGNPYTKLRRLIESYNRTVPENKKLPVLSFHALRHTNASLLIHSNHVDAKTVSRKLGHTNVSTTMKYYVHSYSEAEAESAHVLEDIFKL